MYRGMWLRFGAMVAAVAAMALVCGSGCALRQAYDDASSEEPEASETIPAYRTPSSPVQQTPTPVMTTSPPGPAPTLLADLNNRANAGGPYKYALDERFRRYHRFECPYAPHTKTGTQLQVQGRRIVHRPTSVPTGTHMSRDEIKAKGYTPCRYCRPDLDKLPAWVHPAPERLPARR